MKSIRKKIIFARLNVIGIRALKSYMKILIVDKRVFGSQTACYDCNRSSAVLPEKWIGVSHVIPTSHPQ